MGEYPGRLRYKCSAPYCPNVFLTDIRDPNYVNKHFHKFPKNIERRHKWYDALQRAGHQARSFDDNKTYYLCGDHFCFTAFTNTLHTVLHRTAVPSVFALPNRAQNVDNVSTPVISLLDNTEQLKNVSISNEQTKKRKAPDSLNTRPACTKRLRFDVSNIETVTRHNRAQNVDNVSTPVISLLDKTEQLENVSISNEQSKKRKTPDSLSTRPACTKRLRFDVSNIETVTNHNKGKKSYQNCSILGSIGVKSVKDLTPRKQQIYYINKEVKMRLSKVKGKLRTSRRKLNNLSKVATLNVFSTLDKKLDPAGVALIKSQFQNVTRKRNNWSRNNKIFALALYKRSPRAYRFLQKFILLPSRNTIMECLRQVPFETGINIGMFQRLKKRFSKLPEIDKYISVMFDEIQLSKALKHCTVADKIIGNVDLGNGQRKNIVAKHALVFMIQGLHRKFKQPIGYYFTEHTVSADQLQQIIIDVITALQEISLKPVAIVCDQGATNRKAVRRLLNGNAEAFFVVNNQRIFAIFDPPHLLKNTRNALFTYCIEFANGKIAKFKYIVQCFNIDKTRRFQTMRKMREIYFQLTGLSPYKMKVSVAAKTMSYSVAAAIEAMCSSSDLLPAEALHTAEFIGDVDQLFDSLNGSGNFKNPLKPLLNPISERSRHLQFWDTMLEKIQRWKFIDSNGVSKGYMPFKEGWIQTITAVKGLWSFLHSKGFKFLRTRALNQDPVENLFATIRQYGATNVRPSCYQFISALKTSVLNNLVGRQSVGSNCQEDGAMLLDNLQTFLGEEVQHLAEPLPMHNELFSVTLPEMSNCLDDNNFDNQATTYVCGYLAKKLKISTCELCLSSLTTDQILSQHTFVYFKEYDRKKRLIYASQPFVLFVTKAYDIIYYILNTHGHIPNIQYKLLEVIREKLDFSWFICSVHKDTIWKEIVSMCTSLLIRKFCEDRGREWQIHNRSPSKSAAINKVKNLS